MAGGATLQLTGGEEIRVELSFEQIRDALQEALRARALLELHRSDGEVVVINPLQVLYIENTTRGEAGPAHH